eukprot:4902832-Prymnesium_polylepis.1
MTSDENRTLCLTPPSASTGLLSIAEDFSLPPDSNSDPFQVTWKGGARLVNGSLHLMWNEDSNVGTVFLRSIDWNLTEGFTVVFELEFGLYSSGVSFCFGHLGSTSFGHLGAGDGLRVLFFRDRWAIQVLHRDVQVWAASSVAQHCLRTQYTTIS